MGVSACKRMKNWYLAVKNILLFIMKYKWYIKRYTFTHSVRFH